jgi:hypothetical protein
VKTLSILFFLLTILHGLIHGMGFAKGFKLAEICQLTQSISKPAGALWGCYGTLGLLISTLTLLPPHVQEHFNISERLEHRSL